MSTVEQTFEKIQNQLIQHKIVLYMKGTPESPRCGFSAKVVQALNSCQAGFFAVDVLKNPDIRAHLPEYADWPTFPQLYINGELIGGCDIVTELFQSGELKQKIDQIN